MRITYLLQLLLLVLTLILAPLSLASTNTISLGNCNGNGNEKIKYFTNSNGNDKIEYLTNGINKFEYLTNGNGNDKIEYSINGNGHYKHGTAANDGMDDVVTLSGLDDDSTLLEGGGVPIVSVCTRTAWWRASLANGCLSVFERTPKALQTACMCSDLRNYGVFFYYNSFCISDNDFTSLNSDMECDGYPVGIRDLAVPPVLKREASPQIAALTPWRTSPPKPPKAASIYTVPHNGITAHTGRCGVPGESCNFVYASGAAAEPTTFVTVASGAN